MLPVPLRFVVKATQERRAKRLEPGVGEVEAAADGAAVVGGKGGLARKGG
jgi:hypothetical protein